MPSIPRVGLRLIGVLGVTTALSLTLQMMGRVQAASRPLPVPPEQIGPWTRNPGKPPLRNAERDSPAAGFYLYTAPDQPPVLVSISRPETFNAFRAPYHYLLDVDGRVVQGQEALIPRPNEKLPVYNLYVLADRSESMMVMHWTQAPGEDPLLDPLDTPARLFTTLLAKQPLYICDVYISIRPDMDGTKLEKSINAITSAIDTQIRSLR